MRVFISHSAPDLDLVIQLKGRLQALGQEVIVAAEDIVPGQNWTINIKQLLEESDILLPVITSNTGSSAWVMYELGVFSEYVRRSKNKKFIIPVIFDNAPVPTPLQQFQFIPASSKDIAPASDAICVAISNIQGKKIAQEHEAKEVKEKVELSAADYIKDTTDALQKREIQFNNAGIFWQFLGFTALLIGVATIGYLAIEGFGKNGNWLDITLLASKLITITILLLSISKYSFNLSKTYMHESLKNADRFHAISFGKFYLQVFSGDITKDDIKEIFTDWNFDKSSKFSELSSNDYDPRLVEIVLKAIETIKETK